IDPDGNVRLWSPVAERMLGWTSEEVLSRPLPFVLEDGPAFARTLAQALRESGPWSGTHVRARRKDGGALDVRVWAVPVTGPAQTRAGFVLGIEEGTNREDGGPGQGGAATGPRAPGLRGPGDETQQRLQLFTRLRAIGRTLHRPVSSTEIAESIGESARVLVGADRAAVYLARTSIRCSTTRSSSRAAARWTAPNRMCSRSPVERSWARRRCCIRTCRRCPRRSPSRA
ncbi:MAG: PAS domain-containing protein, partial [Bacillati bacterium ANGP1]